jgi:hypothetical protein
MVKVGSGYRWMVERREWEACVDTTRSMESAGSLVANDPSSPVTNETAERGPYGMAIPYLEAVADGREKWWERMRGNPKRSGEISQAAFLLKASIMGFNLALPWGDSERWDFVVWGRDQQRVLRVQVKGTGRLHRGGYDIQPVHSTRRGRKKRYTKKDIDVIAAHVQPVDAWYLIPIEAVGRAKSLRLFPENGACERAPGKCWKPRRWGQHDWEEWLEAWEVLGQRSQSAE